LVDINEFGVDGVEDFDDFKGLIFLCFFLGVLESKEHGLTFFVKDF
jgi:hypothetical protein